MLFNRDVNAANNIWKISQAAIHGQPRPAYLSWQQQHHHHDHPPPPDGDHGGHHLQGIDIEQAIVDEDYQQALALEEADAMALADMGNDAD